MTLGAQVLFMGKESYEELVTEAERFAEFVETEAIKQEQVRDRVWFPPGMISG